MEADIARVETEEDGERMGVIRYVYDELNTVEGSVSTKCGSLKVYHRKPTFSQHIGLRG